MKRLLVVGAGAAIGECRRSGHHKNDPDYDFPTIQDFGKKLFQLFPLPEFVTVGSSIEMRPNSQSMALLQGIASYLKAHNIAFDSKLLNLHGGEAISAEDMHKSPIGVFLQLEEQSIHQHNVERLCEYVWHTYGTNRAFWDKFIYDGIYFKLFALFTEQFGLGPGVPMLAGKKVAERLNNGDMVLNLNYDIAFDLAIKQAGKTVRYAPNFHPQSISVLKPHGSFNLYCNYDNGDFFFSEPDQISGSVSIPGPGGATFSPHSGILPPRLNKNFAEHPLASFILDSGRPFLPEILTFWGVGLTDSDTDLLDIYKEASRHAETIEFINPSRPALEKAKHSLEKNISYFPTLDEWLA